MSKVSCQSRPYGDLKSQYLTIRIYEQAQNKDLVSSFCPYFIPFLTALLGIDPELTRRLELSLTLRTKNSRSG